MQILFKYLMVYKNSGNAKHLYISIYVIDVQFLYKLTNLLLDVFTLILNLQLKYVSSNVSNNIDFIWDNWIRYLR